jgi:phosphoglycerate kinase
MKTLKDINFFSKKIFVRADLDLPVENGRVMSNERLKAVLPTFQYILAQKPKLIVIISKLGRPDGQRVPELSNKIVVPELEKFLNKPIKILEQIEDLEKTVDLTNKANEAELKELQKGLYFLENVRYWPEEGKNDLEFSRRIGGLFDVYVNGKMLRFFF